MKEYLITWEGVVFGISIVEASSLEDAQKKLSNGEDYDFNVNKPSYPEDWKAVQIESSGDNNEVLDLLK